jgi:hypothetical protein
MALQNLSFATAFTVAAVSRSQAYSTTRQPGKAFEDLELAFKLKGIGYSDLLFSRLVDIAQTIITLRAIQTGQQFHCWTDDQCQRVHRIHSEAIARKRFTRDQSTQTWPSAIRGNSTKLVSSKSFNVPT